MLAMEKSGVHLVVGNMLSTRYERVFVMSRSREFDGEEGGVVVSDPTEGYRGTTTTTTTTGLEDPLPGGDGYRVREIAADGTGGSDDLESATIEYVTTRHFYHISTHTSASGGASSSTDRFCASAAEIAARRALKARALHKDRLDSNRRQLRREMLMTRASELTWNVAGSALGMALSYGIAWMLQGRHQRGVE